ncbi:hypothetical protein [Symbiopectobacterium sp. RP]
MIIAKRLNFDYTIWTENKISVSQELLANLVYGDQATFRSDAS